MRKNCLSKRSRRVQFVNDEAMDILRTDIALINRTPYDFRQRSLLGLDCESLRHCYIGHSSVFDTHEAYYRRHELIHRRHNSRTHAAYQKALLDVRRLLVRDDFIFAALDDHFASLVSALYEEDGTAGKRGMCEKALCALMHCAPALKERMPLRRSELRSWKRITPPRPEMLLTHKLLPAAYNRMVYRKEYECAIISHVRWAALLRISEKLSLNADDVALPGDPGLASPACASTRPKRGRKNSHRSISRRMKHLAAVWHARVLQRNGSLFSSSYLHIYRIMGMSIYSLGVHPERFDTHSCKIGGAFPFSLLGVDSATIALRGRWACFKSMGTTRKRARKIFSSCNFRLQRRQKSLVTTSSSVDS